MSSLHCSDKNHSKKPANWKHSEQTKIFFFVKSSSSFIMHNQKKNSVNVLDSSIPECEKSLVANRLNTTTITTINCFSIFINKEYVYEFLNFLIVIINCQFVSLSQFFETVSAVFSSFTVLSKYKPSRLLNLLSKYKPSRLLNLLSKYKPSRLLNLLSKYKPSRLLNLLSKYKPSRLLNLLSKYKPSRLLNLLLKYEPSSLLSLPFLNSENNLSHRQPPEISCVVTWMSSTHFVGCEMSCKHCQLAKQHPGSNLTTRKLVAQRAV